MFAIAQSNAPVTLENINWGDPKREELKVNSPTGTFPYLQTPGGVISESAAIVNYLVESFKPELLGSNAFEKAQVRQWSEFANLEIARNSKNLMYPLFGFTEYNKTEADKSNIDLKAQMKILNHHLEGKKFAVGSGITLADISLFSQLRGYFQLVWVEDVRKNLCPHVTTWFNSIATSEHSLKSFGRTVLCKVPCKAPRVEKKEEPKKEEHKPHVEKAPKKEGEEGVEDDDKPKKKSSNPLDLLPPSTFILDDFKKEFLNTENKQAVLDEFWKKN